MTKRKKWKIATTLIIILSIILIDSLQALLFDNNQFIKIRENYNGGTLCYIYKGLLVDTYQCTNNKKETVIKVFSYSCSYDNCYVY